MFFSIVLIHAKEDQQIKDIYQISNGIGQTDEKISAFAKASLEENYSECKMLSDLFLMFPYESIESDSDVEMFGKYLYEATDEILRARIQEDCSGEGKILLDDFFKTVMYKKLKEKLEQFVSVILSCSFLSPDESIILRASKIFYPDDYKHSDYTWEPLIKNDKINALEGRMNKIIGLKNKKDESYIFGMIIDVNYTCFLRTIEKRSAMFKGSKIKNMGPNVDVYIEPRHTMNVSIRFLRKKYFERSPSVTYRCYVSGYEKISSEVKKNAWYASLLLEGIDLESSIDLNLMSNKPVICSEYEIANSIFNCNPLFGPLSTCFLDFIIKDDFFF